MRNLGGLIHARRHAPGRLGKARSCTPGMHVDEKSDEVIVLTKRSNNGRQLLAEVVEGRASPKGNSRQAAVVRTLSRVATSIRLLAVGHATSVFKQTRRRAFDPREEPGASAAHAGICAGAKSIFVPTATCARTSWQRIGGASPSRGKV